jgi:hypothetical protein
MFTEFKFVDPAGAMLTSRAVIPPGKLVSGRADLFDRELSERFWEWTEEQVKAYL